MNSPSKTSAPTAYRSPEDITKNADLKHAPNFPPTSSKNGSHVKPCDVRPISLNIKDSRSAVVAGFLHVPKDYSREPNESGEKTAAVLVSGANGGVVGPSSIYLSIADKLASLSEGLPILRLDYRYPTLTRYCVHDVRQALNYLQKEYCVNRFVLVGWSFGGAPVFTLGGIDERVIGCATVASQTSDTEGIAQVASKGLPVLLLHGTGDNILSPDCAEDLHESVSGSCSWLHQHDDGLSCDSLAANCSTFEIFTNDLISTRNIHVVESANYIFFEVMITLCQETV